MNTVADRIKHALAELRLDGNDVARRAGIPYTTWRDIVAGVTESPRKLREIAKAMGVSLDWLADGEGDMVLGGASSITVLSSDEAVPDDIVMIAVSNVKFSGGNGSAVTTYELEEDRQPVAYQLSWFIRERMKPERCKRFRVVGHSQEPLLFAGDWILVNLDQTTVEDGRMYALRYGDELRVKKLTKRLNGGLLLVSENSAEHPPEELSPAEVLEHITIIGRVRDKGGRGGL